MNRLDKSDSWFIQHCVQCRCQSDPYQHISIQRAILGLIIGILWVRVCERKSEEGVRGVVLVFFSA